MMKRLLLLLPAAILLSSCANKSMTRYDELSGPVEKDGFEAGIKVIKDKQIRFVTGCYGACIFKSEALRSMEGRHSYTRDGAFAHLHGRADYTVYMAV